MHPAGKLGVDLLDYHQIMTNFPQRSLM